MLLRLVIETSDGHVLIRASGELDVSNSTSLTRAGEDAMADGYDTVLIDFTGLSFMDSTGLSALVALQRRAEVQHAYVAVVAASGPALRVIRLTGVDDLLHLHDSVEAALRGR
jgi:anti-sigma B factor antagonist